MRKSTTPGQAHPHRLRGRISGTRGRRLALLGVAGASLLSIAVVEPAHASTAVAPAAHTRWHAIPRIFPDGFDRPLGASPALSSRSTQFVGDLVSDYETYYGSVGLNGMPIWRVPADQPLVPVHTLPGCNNFQSETGASIPIPPYATTSAGGDSSIVIYQRSTHTEWELWQGHNNGNGTWSACWGGKIDDTRTSSGVFPAPFGVAASGVSYLATTITENDILSGTIDHTLAVALPRCSAPEAAPADRTDCAADPGQPSEGQWYRMPPTVPMPSGLTPFARMVFRALQTHGMIVTDFAGAVMIESEQTADWAAEGHTGVDPITTSWQGHAEYNVLDGIPWNDLEVINP